MIPAVKKVHHYRELYGGSSPHEKDEVEIVMFNPIVNGDLPETTQPQVDGNRATSKSGTILSGYFNISNTILGSSVLGLPYAFSRTGWLLGTLLLIVCAFSSAFALHTLSLCAMKLNNQKEGNTDDAIVEGASFYSVAKATLPKYTIIIDIAIALKCIGVAISYLIVVGDLMPLVMRQFGASGALLSRELWVFVCFLIALPFNFAKDFSALAVPSSFAIAFVAFFAVLVVLYSMGIAGLDPCGRVDTTVEECVGRIAPVVLNLHSLKAMPIFVFGFTCQQNVFSVVNEMRDVTPGKMNAVIAGSVGTGLLMYLVLAAVGYATFGSYVQADFLLSYPDSAFTSVARVFISLLVTFSYPLQCHPARRCILTIIAHYWPSGCSSVDNCTAVRSYYSHCSVCASTAGDSASVSTSAGVMTSSCCCGGSGAWNRQPLFTIEGSEHGSEAGDAAPNDGTPESLHEQRLFRVVTVFFLAVTLGTALAVHDLSIMLSIVGATGSTTVSYILPGFYYYVLFRKAEDGPAWKRYLALIQGIAGLIIVPLCLTFIFL